MTATPASLKRGVFANRRTRRLGLELLWGAVAACAGIYFLLRLFELELGYGYLSGSTGFQIGHQWLTDFNPSGTRRAAFLVGLWNTVRLVAVGLVAATFLGLVIGVARLSTNWMVRSLATLYVETIRNTPLLVQIIFWYFAVLLQLPRIEDGIDAGGLLLLSNRALVLPSLSGGGLAWAWVACVIVAVVAAVVVRRARARREHLTGDPGFGNRYALLLFFAIAVVSYLALGLPVEVEAPSVFVPDRGAIRYESGSRMTPEFAAVFLGLSVYTAAFIAEIVRGAIQALPRGQSEAAIALGLSNYQRITLVVLPQALRTIIPPLTNQYLNLLKNSSLAVAVAYPELVFVNRTFINSIGNAVPIFLSVLVAYMVLSLLIAAVMNFLNSRVQLVVR